MECSSATMEQGLVNAALMSEGTTVPPTFCLSTIARLLEQQEKPFEQIKNIIEELKEKFPSQFFYPYESMHITVLGLTQFRDNIGTFDYRHIQKIENIVAEVTTKFKATKMHLYGLGITGNQVFIQVLPFDMMWEDLRTELAQKLVSAGEAPITYPNKAPIHMNIMRITNNSREELSKILKAVSDLHQKELGQIIFSRINFVETDFVISDKNTKFLKTFEFKS